MHAWDCSSIWTGLCPTGFVHSALAEEPAASSTGACRQGLPVAVPSMSGANTAARYSGARDKPDLVGRDDAGSGAGSSSCQACAQGKCNCGGSNGCR